MERESDLAEVVRFHGQLCPGLALGYRAAKAAMRTLQARRAEDEELVAIVENDSCAVDAVQWVTGCTFGKGNLVFRDYGKQVLTLARRPSGQGVRIAAKARRREEPGGDREARTQYLLRAPEEELFDIEVTTVALPPQAQIRQSVICDNCGEAVMETRAARREGRVLCIPCAQGGDG